MSYSFVQPPTFAEFISILTSPEWGLKYETMPYPMVDGDEQQHPIHFLSGEGQTYMLCIHDFEIRIAYSLLRSVCARFQIPVTVFGYPLEEVASEQPITE